MTNKQSNRDLIDRIVSSKEFKDSAIYKSLLVYIYESNEKGIVPKESSIAIDVFHKNLSETMDKQSIVRVYIHNLRKKLDSYYRNEGKDDSLKINIPKGKYNIEYHKEKNSIRNKRSVFYILIVLVFLFLCSTLYFLKKEYVDNPLKTYKSSKVWSDLLSKDKETLIIVGDYFLYIDTTISESVCLIRDFSINSEQDLEDYIIKNKESSQGIEKTHHTFLTKLAPLGISKILPIFLQNNSKCKVKLSSNIQWDDIKDNNIIYIGSYKTLNKLQNEFNRLNFKYSIDKGVLSINDTAFANKSFATSQSIHSGIMKDYAVVAKIKGENKNNILFFLSTHDIGNLAIIESFTEINSLKDFEHKYLLDSKSNSFESLFKVKGYEKTDFNSELIYFKELSN